MATGYTQLLGLALPVLGELSDTWGDVVNESVTKLAEDAIAGQVSHDMTSGDWTLSTTSGGARNEARMAMLVLTGTPNAPRNVIAPGASKAYIVANMTEQNIVVKSVSSVGAIVYARQNAIVAWAGSDFITVGGTGSIEIDSGDDLHNMNQDGWYSWDDNNVPTNSPIPTAGHAHVLSVSPTIQRVDVYAQGSIHVWRTYLVSGSWTAWKRALDENDYATQQEAVAGQADNKVMSPLRTAEVLSNMNPAPPGSVVMYAGAAAPSGWLLCDGSDVDRATYAALFTAIGTTWGVGDGSTTFTLPNFTGRYPGGVGDDALGSYLDSQNKAHVHTGTTNPGGAHAHTYTYYYLIQDHNWGQDDDNSEWSQHTGTGTTSTAPDHVHGFTTASEGGTDARPKTTVVNFIIKV